MSEEQDYKTETGENHADGCTCEERATAGPGDPCYPPVTFTTFLLSLASSAMVHMGETPEPESGGFTENLPLAKHTIDILGMLECKTKSNLTDDEAGLLANLLAELRMAYVKKAG